jgi:hypothetical protein
MQKTVNIKGIHYPVKHSSLAGYGIAGLNGRIESLQNGNAVSLDVIDPNGEVAAVNFFLAYNDKLIANGRDPRNVYSFLNQNLSVDFPITFVYSKNKK